VKTTRKSYLDILYEELLIAGESKFALQSNQSVGFSTLPGSCCAKKRQKKYSMALPVQTIM